MSVAYIVPRYAFASPIEVLNSLHMEVTPTFCLAFSRGAVVV